VDAGAPDGTRPDATLSDAAVLDAAEPDTAPPDAAPPDAAEPDAAEPDAAEPDAAPPDAAEPAFRWPEPEPLEPPSPPVCGAEVQVLEPGAQFQRALTHRGGGRYAWLSGDNLLQRALDAELAPPLALDANARDMQVTADDRFFLVRAADRPGTSARWTP